MNVMLFLLALGTLPIPAALPEEPPSSIDESIRGVVKFSVGWDHARKEPDPHNPGKERELPMRLTGYFNLGEEFDRERFVFRVDGIEMRDLVYGPAAGDEESSSLRHFNIEKTDGKAVVELEIYARGEKEPRYKNRVATEISGPYIIGADGTRNGRPFVEGGTFPVDEVPEYVLDIAPPRYRKQ